MIEGAAKRTPRQKECPNTKTTCCPDTRWPKTRWRQPETCWPETRPDTQWRQPETRPDTHQWWQPNTKRWWHTKHHLLIECQGLRWLTKTWTQHRWCTRTQTHQCIHIQSHIPND